MKLFLILSIFTLPLFFAQAALPPKIKSLDLLSGKPIEISTQFNDYKGLVVVFLSAKCPCSNSHTNVLKKMSQKYKDYKFVGVHSNADESLATAQQYFKKTAFNFQIVQDNNTQIADLLQAFKTPHAFILSQKGEILYQGGVTSSSQADTADRNYLDEALSDLVQNKEIRTTEGRTLGCAILRQNELVQ